MTNETIADIIAEMRGMGNYQRYSGDHARVLAGRLDAAHKREMDALKQRCAELDAEVAAKDEVIKRLNDAIAEEQRREMATTENPSAVGNCAKLREAVIRLRDRISMFYKNEWIPYDEWEGANDDANSALAAPPRRKKKEATMQTNNKQREALTKILNLTNSLDENCGVDPVEIRDIARAALAEPVKNCEVGTADDWLARFSVVCERCSGSDCDHRLFKDEEVCDCFARWLQMPYKEGETK